MSSDEEGYKKNRKYSKKRSEKARSRSRSPIYRGQSKKTRESRSSSRGTFDGIDASPPRRKTPPRQKSPIYYSCTQCRDTFESIRELAEHEINEHDSQIDCYHCEKKSSSVERNAAHIKYRHGPKPVHCAYCEEPYGKSVELMTSEDWEEFKDHTQKEAVKKRMYKHGISCTNGEVAVALRGVGACPHGPPVRCKNFPQCPGAKCIYSHNMCRYEETCNKSSCPFDHPNRPRTCMTCINDMKLRKNNRNN